jgi:hypothetical protein
VKDVEDWTLTRGDNANTSLGSRVQHGLNFCKAIKDELVVALSCQSAICSRSGCGEMTLEQVMIERTKGIP